MDPKPHPKSLRDALPEGSVLSLYLCGVCLNKHTLADFMRKNPGVAVNDSLPAVDAFGFHGGGPLHLALYNNMFMDGDGVTGLVALGLDLHKKDARGRTAARYAEEQGRKDLVGILTPAESYNDRFHIQTKVTAVRRSDMRRRGPAPGKSHG